MSLLLRSFLCVAALVLLPSCTCWQLGERLRASCTTWTGLDIERPVDGKIYHKPTHGWAVAEFCYILAPEKTYNIIPPLTCDASGLHYPPEKVAGNLTPTGRVVPVALRRDVNGSYQYARSLSALPGGLVAEDYAASPQLTQSRENTRQSGNKQRPLPAEDGSDNARYTEPGLGRRVLIGTCDYVVDPLLTVVTIPVEWSYSIAALPFVVIYECISED